TAAAPPPGPRSTAAVDRPPPITSRQAAPVLPAKLPGTWTRSNASGIMRGRLSSMKAIRVHRFGAPDVLQLDEAPEPSPGPGEVLVRLHAAGVNPVETYIRAGQYAALPALPYIPGSDGAGEVTAVG